MPAPDAVQKFLNSAAEANKIADPRERALFIRFSRYRLQGYPVDKARLIALLEHGADERDLAACSSGGIEAR